MLLIPLFPVVSWHWFLLIGLFAGIGNSGLYWLLRRNVTPNGLRVAAMLASALEWAVAVSLIVAFAFARQLITTEPAVLLVLLFLGGIRYGWVGLLLAVAGNVFALAALLALMHSLLHTISAHQVRSSFEQWLLLIVVTALVIGAWLMAERQRRKADEAIAAMVKQLQFGLTERERQVLPLLAREELNYQRIGSELHISSETVKTHVAHIAGKLGTRGRWGVVATARERGLLFGPATQVTEWETPPSGDSAGSDRG